MLRRWLKSPTPAVKLFITVWLVYGLHLTTNVVRETYLSVSLGDSLSVRVDPYLGLHPDLFEIEGRGSYINNNPGASLLGAVPYTLGRPFMAALFAAKPELAKPKPPASYDDPRPNRSFFMNESRRRGVDIKLGLAAIFTQIGLMGPLGALSAVLMFFFLRARLQDEKKALIYSLLYAFGSPMFFRAAFLNQNAIVAHCLFGALILFVGLSPRTRSMTRKEMIGAGALLGFCILTDYSGAPLALGFGFWALAIGYREGGTKGALTRGTELVAGALGPIVVLFLYQWVAFGNPFLPAQRYMPTDHNSVKGWFGMSPPRGDLLFANSIGLQYGLFGWCPMLLAAFFGNRADTKRWLDRRAQLFILVTGILLLLFSSGNAYAALQWNTGVRYMVPLVPLLFVLSVPVLERAPRWLFWTLVLPTCVISWSVSMTRENVVPALTRTFTIGFELPLLTVLKRMASGYAPFLEEVQPSPLPIFLVMGLVLYLLWKPAQKQ